MNFITPLASELPKIVQNMYYDFASVFLVISGLRRKYLSKFMKSKAYNACNNKLALHKFLMLLENFTPKSHF